MVVKKAYITSTVIAKLACRSIKVVPRCLWHAMTRGKMGQILCHRENATFWNVCFNRPLRFQRNGLVICTIFCQNILWTVINCSLAFAILDITRKTGPKFFSVEVLPFYQNFLFSTTSYGPKKSLNNFHGNCQNSLLIHKSCSPMFGARDDTRKNGPKSLSSWKQLLFEMFVPINLLGPKQMFLSFAQ